MKHVLVIGVELLSRVLNWEDRTTCVLFGDGAGAVVLGPADATATASRAASSRRRSTPTARSPQSLMIPGGGSREPLDARACLERKRNKVHMRGQDIFKVAVQNLYSASQDALDAAGMTSDEVDWVVPAPGQPAHHRPGRRARSAFPQEKVLINIERVGNTSSASIPILLDESVRDGTIKPGDTRADVRARRRHLLGRRARPDVTADAIALNPASRP